MDKPAILMKCIIKAIEHGFVYYYWRKKDLSGCLKTIRKHCTIWAVDGGYERIIFDPERKWLKGFLKYLADEKGIFLDEDSFLRYLVVEKDRLKWLSEYV